MSDQRRYDGWRAIMACQPDRAEIAIDALTAWMMKATYDGQWLWVQAADAAFAVEALRDDFPTWDFIQRDERPLPLV